MFGLRCVLAFFNLSWFLLLSALGTAEDDRPVHVYGDDNDIHCGQDRGALAASANDKMVATEESGVIR